MKYFLFLFLICVNAFAVTFKTGYLHEKESPFKTFDNLSTADVTVPDSYDLRPKLSQIESQGNCGSCWAFAITAAVRDANLLFNLDPGRISQQYMVSCARDMLGCNGGTMSAANWVVEPKGAPLLSDYPYTASNGRCVSKPVAGSIMSWSYIGSSSRKPTNDEIQKAIMLYGPAVITIGADTAMANFKGSGIFTSCRGTGTNHMVNIIGWSNTENYWIIRNSWGTGWGDGGFGKIKFGCNHIADEAAYFKVHSRPVPATPKEFSMDSAGMTLQVNMTEKCNMPVDEAKKVLQPLLDRLNS